MFKNSIDNGLFPKKIKIAMVTPILKVGKKELVTNYRPISVLPCLSKELERESCIIDYTCILTKIKFSMVNSLDLGTTSLLIMHQLN